MQTYSIVSIIEQSIAFMLLMAVCALGYQALQGAKQRLVLAVFVLGLVLLWTSIAFTALGSS